MQPAGTRRHLFRFERPVETRNAVGEVVHASWSKVGRRRGSCEQLGYGESTERNQTIGQASYQIVIPWLDGLDGTCRVVWESNGGRVLYVTSVVDDERDEQTIQASEKRT